MSIQNSFYKNRVGLNVLARDVNNAKMIYKAAEGYVLIGVLSKDYPGVQAAVHGMQAYGEAIRHHVSVGLGAGDNRQASVVADIAKQYGGCHFNQVFPAVGITRAHLAEKGGWINALVSPSGTPGYVNVSTGPESADAAEQAIIPVRSAIALIRDMGGNALKYFPMNGLAYKEEFMEVARICGDEQFALEPTGGINKHNFAEIIQIALDAGVPKIIPHVYSSIIDKDSGATNEEDVKELVAVMKAQVDRYES